MFPQSALIAYLLPLGLWLVLVASAHRALEPRAAAAGLVAMAVSSLVYLAAGFGLMFGGVGALGGAGAFADLSAYLSLPVDGGVWALAGMKGFFLEGVSAGRVIFVAWLPLVQACAALVAAPLWRRYSLLAVAVAAGLATVAFSLIGMAVWGGGAGAALATQLRLGHGPVDFGGLGIAGMVAGAFSLLVTRRSPAKSAPLPESPHPLRAALGAGLATIGAAGALAANPLATLPASATSDYIIVVGAATGVACLTSLGYAIFVSRRPGIESVIASIVAALIAVSAGAMALPIWAACLLGAIAAVSVILGGYAWDRKTDGFGAMQGVPQTLIPAALGLVMAGVAANGAYGVGLNGVGVDAYLSVPGLGVSGLIGGAAPFPDPGQVTSQIAIVILTLVVAAVLGAPIRLFAVRMPALEAALSETAAAKNTETTATGSAPRSIGNDTPMAAAAPEAAPAMIEVNPPAMATAVKNSPPIPPPPGVARPAESAMPMTPAMRAPEPTTVPAQRAPSLLERLRGARATPPPQPVGQARRVAYPVRVGGRRLILRAMPPENKPAERKLPEESAGADQA